MGDGELTHLLRETDSVNFLPVPVAILRVSAVFWNELEAVSHYGSKGASRGASRSLLSFAR
jgi:hypothetical protein